MIYLEVTERSTSTAAGAAAVVTVVVFYVTEIGQRS